MIIIVYALLVIGSRKFPRRVVTGTVQSEIDSEGKEKSLQRRRWRLLQVESSLACNLRCVMCPWREIAKNAENNGLMTQRIWEAVRPYLPEVDAIDFTGGGEPLLQPRLEEWIADASAAGSETGFLSNGLLLKKERLKRIITAGVDWICISMDGATAELYNRIRIGSDFKQVCENVGNIAALRSGNIPKTMINFVLMGINVHQVEQMVRLTAQLGVDQLNFRHCAVIRGDHGKGYGLFGSRETKEIRRFKKALKKAGRLAKKLDVQTTSYSFTPEEQPVCEQDPRHSMFIGYNGTVAPCINLALGGPTSFLGREAVMPSIHYGRLPTDDLMEMWEADTCKYFRHQFAERVQTHEQTIVSYLVGSSGSSRDRVLQAARNAMPVAPAGCNVCHYLHDI